MWANGSRGKSHILRRITREIIQYGVVPQLQLTKVKVAFKMATGRNVGINFAEKWLYFRGEVIVDDGKALSRLI